NITVIPNKICGEVKAPPSKSFAHRKIICAFLSNSETVIKNVGTSADVLETVSALKEVGGNVEILDNDCYVKPCVIKHSATIKIKESASTFRFLLPIFCALKINAKFILGKKLMSRPNELLISLLNANGANIDNYEIKGEINSGTFFLDASVSSQFVSGLLFALPMLKEKSEIIFTKKLVSKNYVDMTISALNEFSITPKKEKNGFTVLPSKFISKKEIFNEGDFSGASNILALGAINGNVKVLGLNKNSLQGDKKIIDILEKFGANVSFINDILCVKAGKLSGIEVDVDDIIDLAPIIATVGAFASGKTVLLGVNRLRYKESNRLKAIVEFLTKANIKVESKNNQLIVYGGKPQGATFNSNYDHRIEMAEVILSTFANGNSIIENAFNQKKSYTDFYKDYKSLGGEINVNI
ncbi:MAG: 3-phosphoshikimate 1-carboxyvinyltransferase, partial [Firmicutes bacterium]|nr:3-phosphoshikimate 1-carboxyvinyltransferase [Candidatus Caballimonas caccae]